MQGRVLVTGATGFLGSHLAYALLGSGGRVVALARSSSTESARARVESVLRRVSGSEELDTSGVTGSGEWPNLEVIEGDIGAPMLGLDPGDWNRLAASIGEIWHSAASLSFAEADRGAIFRMNVDGTRQVLDLAAQSPTRRVQHVSTAYVAGLRSGRVLESEADVGQKFRNPYEASKCAAETLVRELHASGRVLATIHRPSVVIGDSVTGRATHLHGVYAFIRGMWSAVDRVRRRTGEAIVELPLRVRGSLEGTLNFVPIDYVTAAMIHAGGLESSPGKTFHMTNPDATPNAMWVEIVSQQLGLRGIEFVGEESFQKTPMTRLEKLFHRQMAFYSHYLAGEPVFDRSNTLAALHGTTIHCPRVTEEFNRKMTGWYIDRLDAMSRRAGSA